MKPLGKNDLIVVWREVRYDLGAIQNGWRLSLIAVNTLEPQLEIELYRDDIRVGQSIFLWDLCGPPRTALSVRDSDWMDFEARRIGVRITDDGRRRIDTFKFGNLSGKRGWGTLKVEVDDRSYSAIVPSSLYRFGHNAAEPYNKARIHEWR